MKTGVFYGTEYAVPASLLVNAYFLPRCLINQRGQPSYTNNWDMSIDRWYLSNTESSGGKKSTMELTDAGILLSASEGTPFIQQRVAQIDTSRDYTCAWCDAGGHVTVEVIASEQIKGKFQMYGFLPISIEVTSGTIMRWAALYPGVYTADTVPIPAPPDPDIELIRCQQFLVPIIGDPVATGYVSTLDHGGKIYLLFPAPKMRIERPSFIGEVSDFEIYIDGAKYAVREIQSVKNLGSGICVVAVLSESSDKALKCCAAFMARKAFFSAEL